MVAERLLPPTVAKSCSQRSLPSQAPPGSVFFLLEGVLRPPRVAFLVPLRATKSQEVTVPLLSELSVFHWKDIFHHHGGNHPCGLFPVALGCPCTWSDRQTGNTGELCGIRLRWEHFSHTFEALCPSPPSPVPGGTVCSGSSLPIYLASGPKAQGAWLIPL